MDYMPAIPESTKISLPQRLNIRAAERWPQIHRVGTRYRGSFAYVTVRLNDGDELPLMRLRYTGSAHIWGFAIYRASHDDYQDSWLPNAQPAGHLEDALDTAAGLYLTDPTAWTYPPTN